MDGPTTREYQVLEMIARGAGPREIAHTLGIAEMTVRKHRANLCLKLGCHSAAQLVAHAVAMTDAREPGNPDFRR